MGRKNSSDINKDLNNLIEQYELAKVEDRQIYMDGDQFADIADSYAKDQRYVDAQEVITYGLKLHPGNTELLVEQAYLFLDTQQPEQAKNVAECITEDYDTDVKLLRAELLLNENKFDDAKQLLDNIEDGDDLYIINNIVYLYMDLGYPEAAKEWLDKGKLLYSDNIDFTATMADYLANTGQLDAAVTYYDDLIDSDPYNPEYWIGLAKSRFAAEDCEKAIEACEFALTADESFGEAYAYLGHCYFYLDNTDAAIVNYNKAIELNAIPPEMGYMFLGMAYSNKKAWEDSYNNFQKVIDLFVSQGDDKSPLLTDTYCNMANVAIQMGNYKKAHELCKKALENQPNDYNIYIVEGKIFLKEGNVKKAIKAFDKALKLDSSVETWYLVANAYSDADIFYSAKLCLETAYKLDPNYADIKEKLSILSLMTNEIDDFFKYNSESEHPINEQIILDLIDKPDQTEDNKEMLRDIWKEMKKRAKE